MKTGIKRRASLLLSLAMLLSIMTVGARAFTDDAKINPSYAPAVQALSKKGVFRGYEDGTFRPRDGITRAETAAIVYRIATADVTDAKAASYAAARFDDVAGATWYAGYVGYCADAGLIKGYGDGRFGPGDAVTGDQALAMILRTMGYDKDGAFEGADWASRVEQAAQQLGALENTKGEELSRPASRELVAELLYRCLPAEQPGPQNDPDPYHPLARYTTAVSECDIAKDLGLSEPGKVVEAWIDGVNVTETTHLTGSNDTIDLYEPGLGANLIGDQGRITEIYAVRGGYSIVEINTYFAIVIASYDATSDKNGHTTEATVDLRVYLSDDKGVAVKGVSAEGFKKGSCVLVTLDRADDDVAALAKNNTLAASDIATIVPAQASMSGYLTGYIPRSCNNDTRILDVQGQIPGMVEIDKKQMPAADKLFLGYLSPRADKSYFVFEDGMGNVIALVERAA